MALFCAVCTLSREHEAIGNIRGQFEEAIKFHFLCAVFTIS